MEQTSGLDGSIPGGLSQTQKMSLSQSGFRIQTGSQLNLSGQLLFPFLLWQRGLYYDTCSYYGLYVMFFLLLEHISSLSVASQQSNIFHVWIRLSNFVANFSLCCPSELPQKRWPQECIDFCADQLYFAFYRCWRSFQPFFRIISLV